MKNPAMMPAMPAAYATLRPHQVQDATPQLNVLQRVGGSIGTAILTVVLQNGFTSNAPAAMAADGVGIYGRTDDKVVTFFMFGVIAFFAVLVIVLSLVQIRLENRKERRVEELVPRRSRVVDIGSGAGLPGLPLRRDQLVQPSDFSLY